MKWNPVASKITWIAVKHDNSSRSAFAKALPLLLLMLGLPRWSLAVLAKLRQTSC